MSIITLITDFGTVDGYVGAMKGVILSLAPHVQIVDITHEIPPQAIRQAAWALATAARHFPPGTVHVVVVDPGVGGERRPLALERDGQFFVGPDNGVFTPFLPASACVALTEPVYHHHPVSATFHGRDIFAPVAAHIVLGVPLSKFGPPVADPVRLPPPRLEVQAEGQILGEVVHIDRFGNGITSIGPLRWQGHLLALGGEAATGLALGGERVVGASVPSLTFHAQRVAVEVGGRRLAGIHRTYSEGMPGEALALVGSSGYLEIAVREGSAARALALRPGDPVMLKVLR